MVICLSSFAFSANEFWKECSQRYSCVQGQVWCHRSTSFFQCIFTLDSVFNQSQLAVNDLLKEHKPCIVKAHHLALRFPSPLHSTTLPPIFNLHAKLPNTTCSSSRSEMFKGRIEVANMFLKLKTKNLKSPSSTRHIKGRLTLYSNNYGSWTRSQNRSKTLMQTSHPSVWNSIFLKAHYYLIVW